MSADTPDYLVGPELDKHRQPFNGRCWWCGSTELSSEHKFKRSDLKLMGPELIWTDGSTTRAMQSHNDKRVRFQIKNLCEYCNNSRAQPADKAWEVFSSYVVRNWRTFQPGKAFPLRRVFGWTGSSRGAVNLSKYVVRHFGCRISEAGFPVPDDLGEYLDTGKKHDTLGMAMFYSGERSSLFKAAENRDSYSMLSVGPLVAALSKSTGVATSFATEITLDAVGFLVSWNVDGGGKFFNSYPFLYSREELPYLDIHSFQVDGDADS